MKMVPMTAIAMIMLYSPTAFAGTVAITGAQIDWGAVQIAGRGDKDKDEGGEEGEEEGEGEGGEEGEEEGEDEGGGGYTDPEPDPEPDPDRGGDQGHDGDWPHGQDGQPKLGDYLSGTICEAFGILC